MNRKAEIFFDAVTLLREDLVEEAQEYVFQKRRSGWRRFGSLAACLVLVVSLGMLAALPKGCGSAGSSDAGNNAAAPMERPPSSSEGRPGGVGEGNPVRFNARVIEVLEDGLLVEPLGDGAPEGAERVFVPTGHLYQPPAAQPGDVVGVHCGSVSAEGGRAAAEDVDAVWLAEQNGP